MEKKDEILFLEVFSELGGLTLKDFTSNGLTVQRGDTDVLKIHPL